MAERGLGQRLVKMPPCEAPVAAAISPDCHAAAAAAAEVSATRPGEGANITSVAPSDVPFRQLSQFRRSGSAFGPTTNELRLAWQHFSNNPHFFNGFRITRGGGFARISFLFSPLRYVWALSVLVLIGVNFWSLGQHDILAVRKTSWYAPEGSMFLFTDFFLDKLIYWRRYRLNPEIMVALLDFVLVASLMVRLMWRCTHLGHCPCQRRQHPVDVVVLRWHAVSEIFLILIPRLTSVSAMGFLHFVMPAVFVPDMYQHVERFMDPRSRHSAWPFLKFLVLRLLAVVVGFDAFLVKFWIASRGLIGPDSGGFSSIVGSFAFLNQVLGVVQVRWFAQRRLHIFMFGGEDGYMSEQRSLRKQTWHAMLARSLWEHLPWNRFVAVMITFDDYDFQKLTLEACAEPRDRSAGNSASDLTSACALCVRDAVSQLSADDGVRSRARVEMSEDQWTELSDRSDGNIAPDPTAAASASCEGDAASER